MQRFAALKFRLGTARKIAPAVPEFNCAVARLGPLPIR
jgi:hypothetical protein